MSYTGTAAETLQMWQNELDSCIAARVAFASGAQSYKIGNREITRVNLKELQSRIDYLMLRIATQKRRSFGIVPRDI